MEKRAQLIKRKLALINAKKIMAQFSSIKLIEFEERNSKWIEKFSLVIKEFIKINSTPTYSLKICNKANSYFRWLEESLIFLKDNKEWLIIVPNCNETIWANVVVDSYSKALRELHNISSGREFIVADKNTEIIAAIYHEECEYEIHIKDMKE
ncbi:hypothetical protein Curi_c16500 [Gottschalkia acidurici 9a]|uniref:Uncharacterized protein n=1 Tax=Gottschalkia acidurici (strain ATCC 7906 / DSM 604 / BCRC 14475 / CIP 104303 / KCTC 5404 / NCIMB 10678 / 9a) TaxID=1128398 RepID=K0B0Q3_GOTA9|nr:hypothetical protein [Gottschalkia acidurici]AFS78657.1 hypothetical protein Curi_c16500 [Gottschalkia acidurici 9a]